VKLVVENISLPPEVEQAMDKRTSMGVIGNLNAYTQFQTANAIPDAAKNPGGLASTGAGMVMGMGMANAMQQGMAQPMQPQQPAPAAQTGAGPPPLPRKESYFIELNGAQAGPFDTAALSEKLAGGQLTRATLVWKTGMPQWTAAGSVAELASLFADVPPPLPNKA